MFSELITITAYVMGITGVFTWLAGLWLLVETIYISRTFARDIDQICSDSQDDPVITPEGKSVSDLMDDALTHRAWLQYIYRTLCHRAGVDDRGLSNTTDLISEAVFDGRNVRDCIELVNYHAQNKERQHA